MTWLNKLFGTAREDGRPDYYEEGLELLNDGKFHEALTSFRLALKEAPGDPIVLQQIAISYTRIGMTDEAAKTYRHVLKSKPDAAGAHYGLAFLYLRAGQHEDALRHLRSFLANAPGDEIAAEHLHHAKMTMAQLTGEMEIPEPGQPHGD
jgi:tetratricopeptide (TPR) repeat protein